MKNGDLPAMPMQITDTLVMAMENGAMEAVERISGLTKREMFAMAAMQGLCSDVKTMFESASVGESVGGYMARQAVAAADALLAELEKSK